MRPLIIVAAVIVCVLSTAYGALVYYDNNFKYGRMWETPQVRPHEEPILEMAKGVVPFGGGEALYRNAKGEDLTSPVNRSHPEVIASGRKSYLTYCIQCHGKYHDGMGTVGQSFAPLPGDLRSKKVQNMHEGLLFKEISFGIPGGRQPALATTIEPMDRWRIIAYVKSLGTRKPAGKTIAKN